MTPQKLIFHLAQAKYDFVKTAKNHENNDLGQLVEALVTFGDKEHGFELLTKIIENNSFEEEIQLILGIEIFFTREEYFEWLASRHRPFDRVWSFINQLCLTGYPEAFKMLTHIYRSETTSLWIRCEALSMQMQYTELPDWEPYKEIPLATIQKNKPAYRERNTSSIHVGFISSKFATNMVSSQTLYKGLIFGDKPECVRLSLISTRKYPEADQADYQKSGHAFIDISGLATEAAAKTIDELELDFLVDLSGNTAILLSLKNTTTVGVFGFMSAIKGHCNYIFVSKDNIPEIRSGGYKTLEANGNFTILCPPLSEIEINHDNPSVINKFLTFGCFSRMSKISKRCYDVWAEILNYAPSAKFLTSFIQMSPLVEHEMRRQFASRGINPERLIFLPRSGPTDHAKKYNLVDVVLDSFPLGGGVSGVEAIWMGVPIIAMDAGNRWRNIAPGILDRCNLSELVVQNTDQYRDLAIKIGCNEVFRRQFRQTARQRLIESGLMNEKTYSRNFYNTLIELSATGNR